MDKDELICERCGTDFIGVTHMPRSIRGCCASVILKAVDNGMSPKHQDNIE